MAKGHTVKGSGKKGVRLTHNKRGLPGGARSPDSVPGSHTGRTGTGGAGNVIGNHGNAQKSGTP